MSIWFCKQVLNCWSRNGTNLLSCFLQNLPGLLPAESIALHFDILPSFTYCDWRN